LRPGPPWPGRWPLPNTAPAPRKIPHQRREAGTPFTRVGPGLHGPKGLVGRKGQHFLDVYAQVLLRVAYQTFGVGVHLVNAVDHGHDGLAGFRHHGQAFFHVRLSEKAGVEYPEHHVGLLNIALGSSDVGVRYRGQARRVHQPQIGEGRYADRETHGLDLAEKVLVAPVAREQVHHGFDGVLQRLAPPEEHHAPFPFCMGHLDDAGGGLAQVHGRHLPANQGVEEGGLAGLDLAHDYDLERFRHLPAQHVGFLDDPGQFFGITAPVGERQVGPAAPSAQRRAAQKFGAGAEVLNHRHGIASLP